MTTKATTWWKENIVKIIGTAITLATIIWYAGTFYGRVDNMEYRMIAKIDSQKEMLSQSINQQSTRITLLENIVVLHINKDSEQFKRFSVRYRDGSQIFIAPIDSAKALKFLKEYSKNNDKAYGVTPKKSIIN